MNFDDQGSWFDFDLENDLDPEGLGLAAVALEEGSDEEPVRRAKEFRDLPHIRDIEVEWEDRYTPRAATSLFGFGFRISFDLLYGCSPLSLNIFDEDEELGHDFQTLFAEPPPTRGLRAPTQAFKTWSREDSKSRRLFYHFAELATELRRFIWHFAEMQPEVLTLTYSHHSTLSVCGCRKCPACMEQSWGLSKNLISKPSHIASVCQEAWYESGQVSVPRELISLMADPRQRRWFNFDIDILFLTTSMRYESDGRSTGAPQVPTIDAGRFSNLAIGWELWREWNLEKGLGAYLGPSTLEHLQNFRKMRIFVSLRQVKRVLLVDSWQLDDDAKVAEEGIMLVEPVFALSGREECEREFRMLAGEVRDWSARAKAHRIKCEEQSSTETRPCLLTLHNGIISSCTYDGKVELVEGVAGHHLRRLQ